MRSTRRNFIRNLALSVGSIPSLSPLSFGPSILEATDTSSTTLQNASNKTLVVIQLMGGNDGINTVVPYSDPGYYANRPTIALQSNEILPIDGNIALNSQMTGIMNLWKSNRVGIVQGVSYPNPNLSHYEATAIWESAAPDMPFTNGWLGRYLDVAETFGGAPVRAIEVDSLPAQSLTGASSQPLLVNNPATLNIQPITTGDTTTVTAVNQLNQIASCSACEEYGILLNQVMQSGLDALSASTLVTQAASNYTPQVSYPNDDFGNRLKLAAAMVTSNLNPKIVYLTLGGFDTHANEKPVQNGLLKILSDGLSAFYADLSAQGRENDTMIMTFSEFGRRVKESGSAGTDHGTAEPQFVIGGQVSPGLYGTYPSLTNLDPNGNLVWNLDFRQLYASVLEDWFGIPQTDVLDTTYEKISVV